MFHWVSQGDSNYSHPQLLGLPNRKQEKDLIGCSGPQESISVSKILFPQLSIPESPCLSPQIIPELLLITQVYSLREHLKLTSFPLILLLSKVMTLLLYSLTMCI